MHGRGSGGGSNRRRRLHDVLLLEDAYVVLRAAAISAAAALTLPRRVELLEVDLERGLVDVTRFRMRVVDGERPRGGREPRRRLPGWPGRRLPLRCHGRVLEVDRAEGAVVDAWAQPGPGDVERGHFVALGRGPGVEGEVAPWRRR